MKREEGKCKGIRGKKDGGGGVQVYVGHLHYLKLSNFSFLFERQYQSLVFNTADHINFTRKKKNSRIKF